MKLAFRVASAGTRARQRSRWLPAAVITACLLLLAPLPVLADSEGNPGDETNGDAPVRVSLAAFVATSHSGHVEVSWQSVRELGNQGYNLYRSQTAEVPEELLAYVPSQAPGSSQGFEYVYQDLSVETGTTYWYWLEDMATNGAATLHEPVQVRFEAPTAVQLSSLQAGTAASQPSAPWLLGAAAVALLAVLARVWRTRPVH